MTDLFARKFRDYATRVSFNLTLTRNQIATIRIIREQLQHTPAALLADDSVTIKKAVRADMQLPGPDHWIVGSRKLQDMGLVEWHDPGQMKPKWSEHVYRLTPAGEHVCQLLELAGLIPAMKPASRRKAPEAA